MSFHFISFIQLIRAYQNLSLNSVFWRNRDSTHTYQLASNMTHCKIVIRYPLNTKHSIYTKVAMIKVKPVGFFYLFLQSFVVDFVYSRFLLLFETVSDGSSWSQTHYAAEASLNSWATSVHLLRHWITDIDVATTSRIVFFFKQCILIIFFSFPQHLSDPFQLPTHPTSCSLKKNENQKNKKTKNTKTKQKPYKTHGVHFVLYPAFCFIFCFTFSYTEVQTFI